MQVYIIVTSFGWLGYLIRKFGFTWNHVGLLYTLSNQEHEYIPYLNQSNYRVIESSMSGARERSLEAFLHNVDDYKIFRLRQKLTDIQKREIVAYAWGNVGKVYNFWWLLKLGWRILQNKLRKHQFTTLMYKAHICSSLVANSFKYAGITLVPTKPTILVSPDNIANSPILEEAKLLKVFLVNYVKTT